MIEEMKQAAEDGLSLSDIANQCGISYHKAWRECAKHGIKPQRPKHKGRDTTYEILIRAVNSYRNGLAPEQAEIAREVGVSRQRVNQVLNLEGCYDGNIRA